MKTNSFKVYSVLSYLPGLRKSYALKFMLIAFIGSIIPLLTLTVYLTVNSSWRSNDNLDIFIIILLASLVGMIVTLPLLYLLVSPIRTILSALQQYLNDEQKPKLSSDFGDSVGQLMTYIQYVIEKLDLVNHSFESASLIDPLTGIPNRLAGEERLCQDMARANRDRNQMLIALIDVVQLKSVNEQFGYYLGDVCLTQIVEALSKNIREGDWVARWGGDQFVMVLWNFNHSIPTTVLERIQQQSIKTPMGQLLELHLSISACKYQGNSDAENNLETLLIRLNKVLSQVKQTGKGGIAFTK
ncbi:MAG: hypothetical protein DRQ49_11020 [Gammaproteobacteria bacterium]|nr:MAG: hypothetical protein DRQ41_13750 [Gammaproteobacteria bacterium]RKZ39600.1 MAG: hypothetical protein DRQ49_11020 [Gammaproteobacteria bacterium]RKZ72888.1 MAG: hypothetical protein DRQ57_16150 [Gammaproteobacteria bacterium]